MNLKNYTTTVSAQNSIAMIESLLVEFGSKNIMKEYGPDSRVSALSFSLSDQGMILPFRLPVKTDAAFKWLRNKHKGSSSKILMAQAERMVWKQLYEWVFIQLSMIELGQADKIELFLPHLRDIPTNQTFYEKLKSSGYKLLGNG